jgi:hypothetical protein
VKSTPKKNYSSSKPPRNGAKTAPRSVQRKAPPKKTALDVTPKNEVKAMFVAWFKRNNNVGQVMTKLDVAREIIKKLDKPQNEALEIAMKELVREGLFEIQEDGVTLVLTKQGTEIVK